MAVAVETLRREETLATAAENDSLSTQLRECLVELDALIIAPLGENRCLKRRHRGTKEQRQEHWEERWEGDGLDCIKPGSASCGFDTRCARRVG